MDTSQSNVIFASLLIAFIIFITVKGELPTYLGFLLGGSTPSTGQNGGSGSDAASIAGSVGNSTPTQLNLSVNNSNATSNFSKILDFASLFGG